jgi:TPR repeat protein
MLEIGDIAAARLLFRRAAEAGSAAAALAIGKTNDPRFLAEIGTQGIVPDPVAAAEWYRRAAALGDHDADRLLNALGASAAQ